MNELYTVNAADNIGRIVNDRHMNRLENVLRSHGGEVLCGGEYDAESRYISPTILKLALDSPVMTEETFGPILMVCAVDSIEEAIHYVNSRPKPLSM